MAGIVHDASVSTYPYDYDSARAASGVRAQSDPSVEFDSKGNIFYRIPKLHEVTVSGTCVARRIDTTQIATSPSPIFTNAIGEERGPFALDFFDHGFRYMIAQKFFSSRRSNHSVALAGSSGGSYDYRTDTWSLVITGGAGWTFTSSVGSTGQTGSLGGNGTTVLSSVFPCEVLMHGLGGSGAGAGITIGHPDMVLMPTYEFTPGSPIRILLAVARGIGTFTAQGSVADIGIKGSGTQYIFEIKIKDTTAAASVVL